MNIYAKINDGEYNNKQQYPIKDYKCPCGKKIDAKVNFCSSCGSETKELFASKKQDYQKKQKEYQRVERLLHQMFKDDFFDYFSIEDHPKRELFFNICWEFGHSSGSYKIVNHGEELIELLV